MGTKTQTQALTDLRSQLDELNTTSQYWANSELYQWLNDGVRDIARRAEVILSFNASLAAVAGQAKYMLPPDVIRVHRCEFIPSNSTQVYPVLGSTYDELDQVWGINPTTQSSYPSVFCCWGTPGQMTIQFYPVPAQTGTINFYYYAMPVDLKTDGTDANTVLNVPTGWEDLLVKYAASRALLKARDPHWETFTKIYEDNLEYMIAVTRQAHDNGRYIQTMTGYVPQWLYAYADEQ